MLRTTYLAWILIGLISVGCAQGHLKDPLQPGYTPNQAEVKQGEMRPEIGEFKLWGFYDLMIARDGSFCSVVPNRTATADWGYHFNVVRLLESSPCTNCLNLSNIYLLPNGDLSVDISIRHPFVNPQYTGFDVRGIIMFPASQYVPDNDLLALAGFDPLEWHNRFSSHQKGDAELMNPDAWTTLWAPDGPWHNDYDVPYSGYPIQNYYPGKFASGANLGTINAYRHFWSNDNRHMFEVGKTVARTYIIRPPADGPIEASYAIYAHWDEPLKTPVTDPATDFGPEANSPIPYEFWVTQDSVIDPDAPNEEQAKHIHWHVKSWTIGPEHWRLPYVDLLGPYGGSCGGDAKPHPSGLPDDYTNGAFNTKGYEWVPDWLPGEWPYIFAIRIENPKKPWWLPIAHDFYIADIAIEAPDGEW